MFDTMIQVLIAYMRKHPEELALNNSGTGDPESAAAMGVRLEAWRKTPPNWNAPAMTQRLEQEARTLVQDTPEVQMQYYHAAKSALAQLRHGEHS